MANEDLDLLMEEEEQNYIDPSLAGIEEPVVPTSDSEILAALRANRDSEVEGANLAQGIGSIASALASQGRVKNDPAVFDAVRAAAQAKAKEGGSDVAAARKAVSDAVKAKVSQQRHDENLGAKREHNEAILGQQDLANKRAEEQLRLAKEAAARADEAAGRQKEKDDREKAKNKDIELLPAEDQKIIQDLAGKTATKLSVANQMEAALADWDTLSPDQQLDRGRSLIKTLNSAEGSDAVSKDEAARIAGRLDVAFGNLNPNDPNFGRFQVGRDLGGFKEQVVNTAKSLKEAAKINDKLVNDTYTKHGVQRKKPAPAGKPKKVIQNGVEYTLNEATGEYE